MLTYTIDIWTRRKHMLMRGMVSCVVFVCALLVYPIPTMLMALVALSMFRAYEVILAGFVLDALLAPGGGVLGSYTYTALCIVAGILVHVMNRILRGPRNGV